MYKMWYSQGTYDLSKFDGVIDDIFALDLGNLINDLKNFNLSAITDNATPLETIIDHLASLTVDELKTLFEGTTSIISYATSTDGINWEYQSDVLQGTGGAWDDYYVSAPCVIKNGANDYEMWYTGGKTDLGTVATLLDDLALLSSDNISTLLEDLIALDIGAFITHLLSAGGDNYLLNLISHLFDVLGSTGVAIGHCTSTDGVSWTKDANNPVLE